jgi:hypothetical protein
MGVRSKKFRAVATKAFLPATHKPWSGDYWPTFRGGIAHRWQTMHTGTTYTDYLYSTYPQDKLQVLTQNDLDLLSPAEKYDLWTANHHFPVTNEELQQMQSSYDDTLRDVPHWYGLCHGWVIAAAKEPQPGALAQVVASTGRVLRFFSSDIKALLSKYYAASEVATKFVGGRCTSKVVARDASGRIIDAECRDLNPATFHLVLDQYIAHKHVGVNVDIDEGEEVWTQPAYGYEFSYQNFRPYPGPQAYPHAAAGTVGLVDVVYSFWYADESTSSRHPTQPIISKQIYEYTLELNANEFIIGGEWRSERHPDYLWQLHDVPQARYQGGLDYSLLKELVRLSQGSS